MNQKKADFERWLDEIEAEIERKRKTWGPLDGVSIYGEGEMIEKELEQCERQLSAEHFEIYCAALLEHTTRALKAANESVDEANISIILTINALRSPDRRSEISDEARREIAKNPGFLDEVMDLIEVPAHQPL